MLATAALTGRLLREKVQQGIIFGSMLSGESISTGGTIDRLVFEPITIILSGIKSLHQTRGDSMASQPLGVCNLQLLREPGNPADRYEVQLHNEHGPIAYLPSKDARRISRILDAVQTPLFVRSTHGSSRTALANR